MIIMIKLPHHQVEAGLCQQSSPRQSQPREHVTARLRSHDAAVLCTDEHFHRQRLYSPATLLARRCIKYSYKDKHKPPSELSSILAYIHTRDVPSQAPWRKTSPRRASTRNTSTPSRARRFGSRAKSRSCVETVPRWTPRALSVSS